MAKKHYTSFDQTAFNANFHGLDDLVKKTIQSFILALPKMIENLQWGIDEKNPINVELAAHNLKGALSNFYAEPARLLAWQLEQMGHGTITSDAENTLRSLVAELDKLILDLQDYEKNRMSQ
jgi:HPt (histidine-containing phosphotransfer) domain-containing protein